MLNGDKQVVKKEVDEKQINYEEKNKNISQEIKTGTGEQKNINKSNKLTKLTNLSNFSEFKKIRINNTLAMFNRKDLLEFKNKIYKIKDYMSSDKYGSIVSLLLDGELKAKGNNYIIYVYSDNKLSDFFNNSIKEIELFMNKMFNEQYKMISVSLNDWEVIKKDFNNSLKTGEKKYALMKDIELVMPNDEKNAICPNDIDNMFSEIVKYE